MTMVLRFPRTDDEAVLRRVHAELAREGFDFLLSGAGSPWEDYLAKVARDAAGSDLPEDRVPADFLVAEVDGELVGRVSIRHRLNEMLTLIGGHVGYAVAPEHRGRGYATQMLRLSLVRLAELGVDRVLVTCDDDNQASAVTIERCGGVLENVVEFGGGAPKRRYWIENATAPAPAAPTPAARVTGGRPGS